MLPAELFSSVRDRLSQSWFLAVSALLHLLLLFALGTVVLVEINDEPSEMTAHNGLLQPTQEIERPQEPGADKSLMEGLNTSFSKEISSGLVSRDFPMENLIKNSLPSELNFVAPGHVPSPSPDSAIADIAVPNILPAQDVLKRDQLMEIGKFTKWSPDAGKGKPLSQRRFAFKAYLGKYSGGNWQSTVEIRNGKIAAGSLPNLLFLMSKWSGDRIETNERNVEAIPLDSPALLNDRPPFIFLTGTRNFSLTDSEIENLRTYIRLGGAVWGDSSVPGRRSAFDIAFEREMKRVLGEQSGKMEELPADHPVFVGGYFPKIRRLPSGINHTNEPVKVMRWNGEIAIIHTRNDYGDMWRVGLDNSGGVDLSKNEKGQFVATDPALWSHRGIYLRNLEAPAIRESFEFGINMVVHLLTRWEDRTASVGSL